MVKVDKLTSVQEAKLKVYLEEWLANGRSIKPIDRDKTIESINWLYKFNNNKTPYMWFCDSPLQIQLIINTLSDLKFKKELGKFIGTNLTTILWDNLWNNLRYNLSNNLRNNLNANLWTNLRANLSDNLTDNLRTDLTDNLRDNLRDKLKGNLWNNLQTNLSDNLWNNLSDNLWTNLSDNLWTNLSDNLSANLSKQKLTYEGFFSPSLECNWVGFYDFILNEIFPERKDEFKVFNNECKEFYKNVYHIVPFENICFISERPTDLNLDQKGKLNSLNKAAISFKDTYEINYINGKEYKKEDWEALPEVKLAQNKDTIKTLLGVRL